MGGGVLVTGGAGYIGSHVTLALLEAGYRPVVLDDFSTGRRDLVPAAATLVEGDVADGALTDRILREYGVAAVMHFAGSIVVPESVRRPLAYYRNNTAAALSLIESCVRCDVTRFVFSSTAAVYGMPDEIPVDEDAPTRPINPYGASKLMTEWMLRDAAAAHGLQPMILRYFNVAGADPLGRSGQCSKLATHLIKIACEAAVGRRDRIEVYGADYPTPDGTCLRDYIHVADLAAAHVAALRRLEAGGAGATLNCGYGRAYSVREVLAAVERAAGRKLDVVEAGRREGDPPALAAAAGRIRTALDWRPRFDDLEIIVAHALAWEKKLAAASA